MKRILSLALLCAFGGYALAFHEAMNVGDLITFARAVKGKTVIIPAKLAQKKHDLKAAALRIHAQHLREVAKQIKLPLASAKYVRAAEGYDLLADKVEFLPVFDHKMTFTNPGAMLLKKAMGAEVMGEVLDSIGQQTGNSMIVQRAEAIEKFGEELKERLKAACDLAEDDSMEVEESAAESASEGDMDEGQDDYDDLSQASSDYKKNVADLIAVAHALKGKTVVIPAKLVQKRHNLKAAWLRLCAHHLRQVAKQIKLPIARAKYVAAAEGYELLATKTEFLPVFDLKKTFTSPGKKLLRKAVKAKLMAEWLILVGQQTGNPALVVKGKAINLFGAELAKRLKTAACSKLEGEAMDTEEVAVEGQDDQDDEGQDDCNDQDEGQDDYDDQDDEGEETPAATESEDVDDDSDDESEEEAAPAAK